MNKAEGRMWALIEANNGIVLAKTLYEEYKAKYGEDTMQEARQALMLLANAGKVDLRQDGYVETIRWETRDGKEEIGGNPVNY